MLYGLLQIRFTLLAMLLSTLGNFAYATSHMYIASNGLQFIVSNDNVSVGSESAKGTSFEIERANGEGELLYRKAQTTTVLVVPESFVSGLAKSGVIVIRNGFSSQTYDVALLSESAIRNKDLISDEGVVFRFTSMGVVVSGLSNLPYYLRLQANGHSSVRVYKYPHTGFTVTAPTELVDGKATTGIVEISNGFTTKTYTINVCESLLRR